MPESFIPIQLQTIPDDKRHAGAAMSTAVAAIGLNAQFVCPTISSRIVFGAGASANLSEEMERASIQRAFVIASNRLHREAPALLQAVAHQTATTFMAVTKHTPVTVTEKALALLQSQHADGIVAIGGGSAIGLSKALAVRTGLKQIVLPTTYAGSEVTPILGETSGQQKTVRRSVDIMPETVIYDPELTVNLSPELTASSGLNAIAHGVEALYARAQNPIVIMFAEAGISCLANAIPHLISHPRDKAARSQAVYGAFLCGLCLAQAEMSLHHKLCHVLGGLCDLPHAPMHAALLPHTFAYLADAVPDASARIAAILNAPDAVSGLAGLAHRLEVPRALGPMGMPERLIDTVAEMMLQAPYDYPCPLGHKSLREMIARAWRGDTPQRPS